jgi:hypothetical protein
MNNDNNKKYLLIFSGILLGYQYLGLVIDGNIPYTQIKFSQQANIPIVLVILIIFFGTQFVFYWFQKKEEDRSLFELLSSIPIALIAVIPVCYGYLKKFGVDWKIICLTVFVLLLGVFLAIAVDFIIAVIFSLRTPEEMKKMGLGKIPSASKVFIRCLFFLIPLSVAFFFLLNTYKYLFPVPLDKYWIVLFFVPTLLMNFQNFISLCLCLGPTKIRKKALVKLRVFRRAMDVHEMLYQYIGVEKFPESFEIPPICVFAENGLLVEMQEALSRGVNPNSQDSRGWCPLMYATAEGHPEIVDLLLEHGADPNIINYLGRSAIMYASNYGFHEIAQKLLKHGATTNFSRDFSEHPPLSAAAGQGHLDMVKLLVEHGANVMHKNREGETALDISMDAGHGEVAKHLRKIMLELDETTPEEKTNLINSLEWVKGEPTE